MVRLNLYLALVLLSQAALFTAQPVDIWSCSAQDGSLVPTGAWMSISGEKCFCLCLKSSLICPVLCSDGSPVNSSDAKIAYEVHQDFSEEKDSLGRSFRDVDSILLETEPLSSELPANVGSNIAESGIGIASCPVMGQIVPHGKNVILVGCIRCSCDQGSLICHSFCNALQGNDSFCLLDNETFVLNGADVVLGRQCAKCNCYEGEAVCRPSLSCDLNPFAVLADFTVSAIQPQSSSFTDLVVTLPAPSHTTTATRNRGDIHANIKSPISSNIPIVDLDLTVPAQASEVVTEEITLPALAKRTI